MNLQKAIKIKRTELGLSQTDIINQLQIGHNQLSLIENGKITPTIPTLLILCKVFNCKLSELISLSEKQS